MKHKILEYDPSLKAYEKEFDLRMERYEKKKKELLLAWILKSFVSLMQSVMALMMNSIGIIKFMAKMNLSALF